MTGPGASFFPSSSLDGNQEGARSGRAWVGYATAQLLGLAVARAMRSGVSAWGMWSHVPEGINVHPCCAKNPVQ